MKRFIASLIAVFLSLILFISTLSIIYTASAKIADSGSCGENLVWTLDDKGTLVITGRGEMEDFFVSHIEDRYDTIPPWYSINENIKSLNILDGVTTIGEDAFSDCTSLTSITIPDSVESIGYGAFEGCSGLTSITVGKGNTTYDSRNDCNAIIETATNELLKGCQNTIIPDSVTSIGLGAFSGCTGLESITIPNSVTSIGEEAFGDCTSLERITIPLNVVFVHDMAFRGCTNLESIYVDPNNPRLYSVDGVLFSKNDDGSVKIEAYPSGKKESTYYIPNEVTALWEGFDNKNLKTLIVQEGIKEIGYFFSAEYVETLYLPSSLERLELLSGCKNVKDVYYAESEKDRNDKLFYIPEGNGLFNANWHYNSPVPTNHTHRYEQNIVSIATCSTPGIIEYVCSCGESYTKTTILEHDIVVINSIPPTCVNCGLSEGKTCSICGEMLVGQEEIPALGHTDSNGDEICDSCGINMSESTSPSFMDTIINILIKFIDIFVAIINNLALLFLSQ